MERRVKGLPVPARSARDHWVERVRPGARLHLIILSEALWGLEAHWTGNRTIECSGKANGCRGCAMELPKRWKGGMHVWDLTRKESYFVELTPAAARKLMATAAKDEPLRGLKIDLFRSGQAINGRLLVEVIGGRVSTKSLPPEQDPQFVLRWLWAH